MGAIKAHEMVPQTRLIYFDLHMKMQIKKMKQNFYCN